MDPARHVAPYLIEPRATLDESMLDADPFAQFSAWLADAEAAGLPQPNAMVVATVSATGQPRARTVLLREHSKDGFGFYTNKTSRKGQDLAGQPRACLLFPWHAMFRQVIIEGTVSAVSAADSEPYFHSRPHGSQVAAWASRQSSVIASRAELDERYAELTERWPEDETVPMPDFWGGYRLAPQTLEFWQGQPNRLHDRLRYRQVKGDEDAGGSWAVERLSP
jgi:pyridoxamine 5'-phosphate oxidase